MGFKKWVTLLAAALSLFSASVAPAAEQRPLKVWCWMENFNIAAMKIAEERYQKDHPGFKLEIEKVENADIINRLDLALSADNRDDLPDIMLLEDYKVQNFIQGYPGFLNDLTPYLDRSNFAPYKLAVCSDNIGHMFGVPFDSGVSTTYVRIDLFEQAGYTLADFDNLTWDKLIEMGKKVKEVTGIPLMPFAADNLMELSLMLQSAGTWYTAPDGQTVIIRGNKALKEGLLVYKKLHDAGLLAEYQLWDEFISLFQEGKVSAVVSSCWLAASVLEKSEQKGLWRIVKLPKLNLPDASDVSNQGGSQWYVNAYSPVADEASKFLAATFGSDRDFINVLVKEVQLVSTMRDAAKLPAYDENYEFFGGQPILKMMAQWAEKIPPVNYGRHSKTIEEVIRDVLQKVFQGEDVEVLLDEAQDSVEAQIEVNATMNNW